MENAEKEEKDVNEGSWFWLVSVELSALNKLPPRKEVRFPNGLQPAIIPSGEASSPSGGSSLRAPIPRPTSGLATSFGTSKSREPGFQESGAEVYESSWSSGVNQKWGCFCSE